MAQDIINYTELSDADLRTELQAAEAEYQRAKFDHAVKGLANPLEIRAMRRGIARIHTELRSRDLAAMTPEQLENRSRLRARRARR